MMAKFKTDNGKLIKLIDDHNYEGTAGDVVGKAKGYSYGPAFKFEYVLLVPVKKEKKSKLLLMIGFLCKMKKLQLIEQR